jgi:hypothetical protein
MSVYDMCGWEEVKKCREVSDRARNAPLAELDPKR